MPKRILFVFPTLWDAPELEACRAAWEGRYAPELGEPDDDRVPWDFDAPAYIERLVAAGGYDGYASSSDFAGAAVAAAVAARLGLPGAPPASVLRASHKYHSRVAQAEPSPWFALVDPARPPELRYPCFIKPVKAAFSTLARRLDSRAELEEYLAGAGHFLRDYPLIFNRLLAGVAGLEPDAGRFIAEGLLRGRLATLEGFVTGGRVEVIGVTDSVLHPNGSFARFDYPSELPRSVQERMAETARRAVARLGLDRTLFNIELMWDPDTDALGVVELNPRLAGQFADLHLKVDGASTYELALALAAGDEPRWPRGQGPHRAASSVPLRVFAPVRVARAPRDARAAQALFPGTLVWLRAKPGDELRDFSFEDGRSFRYAVINAGGRDRAEALARVEAVRRALDFSLESLP